MEDRDVVLSITYRPFPVAVQGQCGSTYTDAYLPPWRPCQPWHPGERGRLRGSRPLRDTIVALLTARLKEE
jgi:hypothetical protein